MNAALITARIGLGAVFLLAALAKLADMPGSRAALEGFNVRRSLVPWAAVALPALEVAAAVLLVVAPVAQVGGALAVLLLLAFILGIVAALRRGAHPDCHCFGQIHSRPAGPETVARNVFLAGVGVVVAAAGPGPALDSWIGRSSGELVALAVMSLLVIVLAYVAMSLWTENRGLTGRSRQHVDSPPLATGQEVPQFEAFDGGGSRVRSDGLFHAAPHSVLVFTSSTCGPCVALLPELARWQKMLEGRLAIHVLAAGDDGENRRLSDEHGMPLLLDPGGTVARAFRVSATPSAYVVDETGRVAAPVAIGAPSIEGLIRVALKRPPAAALELDVRHVEPSST